MVDENLRKVPIPVVVFTNDKNLWLLNGFQYLFNKYWSSEQPVTIVGFDDPRFYQVALQRNFSFVSLGKINYPASCWSNEVIEFIKTLKDDYFIMFLEDYWLYARVNLRHIKLLRDYIMYCQDKILRIDLTADRASHKQLRPYFSLNSLELIETPCTSPYQMSFQAAIWDRHLMLEVLRENEDPWTSEIDGTKRLALRPDLRVLGTLNHPVKYKPVYRTRRCSMDISKLQKEDQEYITAKGWV